jgi:hypothetical protein
MRFVALPLAVVLAIPPLRWGPDGHKVIAQIALDRLSPAVAAETRRLLGGQSIVDVSSWADQERSRIPATGPWHYVDVNIHDTSYVASRDCPDGACVVTAVQTQLGILADRTRPDTARATALKYVVHFIGDLHQPLHSGENDDKGGNDVSVTFNGRSTNLHSLWDSGLFLSYGESDSAVVASIHAEAASRADIATISIGTVESWVMQSHDVARDVVYGLLPASHEITAAYAAAARPVIREQFLRGGVRLAAALEKALARPR